MIYLLSLAILQCIAFVQTAKVMRAVGDRDLLLLEAMAIATALLLPAVLMGFPLMREFLNVGAASQGHAMSVRGEYLPLWCLGAGAVLAIAVFGYRLFRHRQSAVGSNVIGLLIGLYMLFVTGDQVVFFKGHDDAGMVNWGVLREQGAARDIECDSDLLVVKGLDSEVVTYRCPHPGVVVLGRFTSMPIVLWPSYTEGESHQLGMFMHDLNRNAKKVE